MRCSFARLAGLGPRADLGPAALLLLGLLRGSFRPGGGPRLRLIRVRLRLGLRGAHRLPGTDARADE